MRKNTRFIQRDPAWIAGESCGRDRRHVRIDAEMRKMISIGASVKVHEENFFIALLGV